MMSKIQYLLLDFGTNNYELYDLEKDIGERDNLASKHPDIVEELQGMLKNFKN